MNDKRRQVKAVAGRKLACFAAAFFLILMSACYGLPENEMIMYGAAAGAVAFVLLSLFCGVKSAFNISVIAASAASVVFIIGVWLPYTDAVNLSGQKNDFAVMVESYPEYGSYYTIVQGTEEGSGLKSKVIVYFNDLRVRPGDRLSFYGRAAVDRNKYFISSMADSCFLTLRASKNVKVDRAEALPLKYYPLAFSKWLREDVILRYFGTGDEGGLLAALITGSTENISYEFKNALSLSGTSHIISVSGMHIGIISGFALYLLGKKWGIYASMPFIIFFGMSTGLNPPIVRAIIMLGMTFLAFISDRENDGVTTVMAALLFITIVDPCASVSVSLQLSFAAVLGILFFNEGIRRTLNALVPERFAANKAVSYIINAVSVSVSATMASFPVSMCYFDRVSIISPFANLAVLWLVSVLMAAGIAFIPISFIPGAAVMAANVIKPVLSLFIWLVEQAAAFPYGSIAGGNICGAFVVLLWCLLLAFGYAIRPKLRCAAVIVLCAASVILSAYALYADRQYIEGEVFAEGMVLIRHGDDVAALVTGESSAYDDLAYYLTNRLYKWGLTEADNVMFSEGKGSPSFRAENLLTEGAYTEPFEINKDGISIGNVCIAVACGSKDMPKNADILFIDLSAYRWAEAEAIIEASGAETIVVVGEMQVDDDTIVSDALLSGMKKLDEGESYVFKIKVE